MLDLYTLSVFSMRDTCLGISSNAHGCVPLKLDFLTSKQVVNLFQGEVSCFRVEEPDEREEAEVEDYKIDVSETPASSCYWQANVPAK